MLPYLPEIQAMGFAFCFQFTLTGYGPDLEKGLRDKADILKTFEALSRLAGPERIQWRYDPILLHGHWTVAQHLEVFRGLCARLSTRARGVTISFVDSYRRTKAAGIRTLTPAEMRMLGEGIGSMAASYGLAASTCCEEVDLTAFGIGRGACINREMLEAACGYPLELHPDAYQRPACGCMASLDIGAYNTCPGGCVYCYASDSLPAVRRRLAAHDPAGELLFGRLAEGDKVREKTMVSLRATQLRLE